jgi:Arc/MetJ-type ribon-helix-helix transcriptional regulator
MPTEDDSTLTVQLSRKAVEAVNEIQRLGRFRTLQDAIRRAIEEELFLEKCRAEGWEVILRKDDEFREIIWPSP